MLGISGIWKLTRDHMSHDMWFPTMWHLTCVDSDKPVQPPVKLRNSKCCLVSSLTVIDYSSDKQRLWSDCAYAQAGLSISWMHISHCWKFHVVAHMCQRPLICEPLWKHVFLYNYRVVILNHQKRSDMYFLLQRKWPIILLNIYFLLLFPYVYKYMYRNFTCFKYWPLQQIPNTFKNVSGFSQETPWYREEKPQTSQDNRGLTVFSWRQSFIVFGSNSCYKTKQMVI